MVLFLKYIHSTLISFLEADTPIFYKFINLYFYY
jgi:hypothetical protein